MSVAYVTGKGNLCVYDSNLSKDQTILDSGDIQQICIDGGGQTLWLLTNAGIKCVNLNTYASNLSWKEHIDFPGGTTVQAQAIAAGGNGEYAATSYCYYIDLDGNIGRLDSNGNNTNILAGYKAQDIAIPNLQPPASPADLPDKILPVSFVLTSITKDGQTTEYAHHGNYPIVWFDAKDHSETPTLYGSPENTTDLIYGNLVVGLDYELIGLLDSDGNFKQYDTKSPTSPVSTYDNNNFLFAGTNIYHPDSPIFGYEDEETKKTQLYFVPQNSQNMITYTCENYTTGAIVTAYTWNFFTGESNV